jgi:type I restriction enzyme S subunit
METTEWPLVPLGELTENLDGRRVPVKENDRKPGPYPYYGASGIVDRVDGYLFDGEYLLIGEDGENLRTRQTPIAFMATGRFWVNNHAHIVRGNHRADTRFLSYVLSQTDISGYLTGSTMPKLTQGNLNRLPVIAPPLAEQKAIAAVLGALDDKIQLNRRMNATLEAMARALFQSWFVDFDPVRLRLSYDGQVRPTKDNPTGMPAEALAKVGLDPGTAGLFPGHLEDSPIGHIPKGWTAGTLGDIGNNSRRGVQPDDIAPNTPYIALEHMPRRCIALGDWADFAHVASGKFVFKKGEILFGKLRPYFHKVGVAPFDGVCSTDILVLAPKSPEWFGFLLGHASSDELIQFTDLASTGTKMPRTNWSDISSFKVALPPKPIAAAFTRNIQPMLHRIHANLHQSRTLATLRDTLLPKLLSGETPIDSTIL